MYHLGLVRKKGGTEPVQGASEGKVWIHLTSDRATRGRRTSNCFRLKEAVSDGN